MAITLQLQQVVCESDGTYTVTVSAVRDNGDVVIAGKTFQCKNATELKAAVKPKFEGLILIEQKKDQIRAIAQGVLDEINSEVEQ